MKTKRILYIISILLVINMYGCKKKSRFTHESPSQRMQTAISYLARSIALETKLLYIYYPSSEYEEVPVFQLPEGDVKDLEKWLNGLNELHPDMFYGRFFGRVTELLNKDTGSIRLLDYWGHSLVYQCPAEDPDYMFILYSLGPDGVDNTGDEIYRNIKFEEYKDWFFEDPNFNGDTYKKYRGKFIRRENKIGYPGFRK